MSEAEATPNWFNRLISATLRRYAESASADYLVKKYPGLPKDIIADRYVTQQARMAALAGAAAAAVVSGAALVSVALASSGVGVPALAITLPVGLATFAAELSYTIRLQIRTAYDLCNLYGLHLRPDDPEDVQRIFALGMGIRAGELTGTAIQRLAPSVARQQARRLMRTGVRRAFQDWAARNMSRTVARRYLTEKFLLSAIVPGVSIVLAAGWNYLFTRGLGRSVKARVRSRGLSAELVRKLRLVPEAPPEFLLETALRTMSCDSQISENALTAYRELANRLTQLHPEFSAESLGGQWGDDELWLAKAGALTDQDIRDLAYAVAETFSVLDGRLSRQEAKWLAQLAQRLGVRYDRARLRNRARQFYIEPAGRGCTIAVALVAFTLLMAACACSIWSWYFVSQLGG